MHRTIMIGLSFFYILNSSAQSWQWFPKDSLRVYVNPTQNKERLTGIDFRTYQIKGDTTEIDLFSFTRPDTVDGDLISGRHCNAVYVIHGNSNFGNRIIESTDLVQMLFKNKLTEYDTLTFFKNAIKDEPWKVFENDTIRISANLKSKYEAIGDSVMLISITCTNKQSGASNTLPMLISKSTGIIQTPVFFDLFRFPKQLSLLTSVDWLQYREMTEFEFYNGIPGTVSETSGNKWLNPDRVDFNQRDSFIGAAGKTLKYITSMDTNTVGPGHYPINGKLRNVIVERKYDTIKVFNPIPGQVATFEFDPRLSDGIESTLGGKYFCDQYLMHIKLSFGRHEFENDTIFSLITIGMPVMEYSWTVLQGVGVMNSGYPGITSCTYFKIPGGCEMGEPDFRFTSTADVHSSQAKIYPNPSSKYLFVDGVGEIGFTSITNVTGQTFDCKTEDQKVILPSVPFGLYLLQAQTSNGLVRRWIQIVD